jgi:hypothetical protein
MAIGIVSSEVLNAELDSLTVREVITKPIIHGRGNNNEVPESLRKVIAEEAISGVKAEILAEQFNVSESSVSAYKQGATSTASYDDHDEHLKAHVDLVKTTIAKSARDKIIQALKHIDDDKFTLASLKDVASVAKDMSVVMEKMEGGNRDKAPVQQVVIFAPRQRTEDDYKVIDVSAQ